MHSIDGNYFHQCIIVLCSMYRVYMRVFHRILSINSICISFKRYKLCTLYTSITIRSTQTKLSYPALCSYLLKCSHRLLPKLLYYVRIIKPNDTAVHQGLESYRLFDSSFIKIIFKTNIFHSDSLRKIKLRYYFKFHLEQQDLNVHQIETIKD